MATLYFYPGLFGLGLAVGVLGLVLVLSLIVAYAYEDRTLLALAGYLALMVLISFVLVRIGLTEKLVQRTALVIGSTAAVIAQMWLMRDRTTDTGTRVAAVLTLFSGAALVVLFTVPTPDRFDQTASYIWLAAVLLLSGYTVVKHRATVGPWMWWFLAGTLGSLGVAIAFLSGHVEAEKMYWPQVLLHVLQVPPIYLALVWRSRLLNESQLRSSSANVTDPLTGLSTRTVLIERIMRVASRANKTSTVSAVFLIEVQNWRGLLAELGEDFSEKLLLEVALRVRRAIGDNDLAARVNGGRFAVVAQGLIGDPEVNALATRLLVSGLRIDSPLLTGVEFKFRIVVCPLVPYLAANPTATSDWLKELTENFNRWPSTHRSRHILLLTTHPTGAATISGKLPPMNFDISSDPPSKP